MRGAFGLWNMERGSGGGGGGWGGEKKKKKGNFINAKKKKKKKNCFQAVTTVTYVTWHLTLYI